MEKYYTPTIEELISHVAEGENIFCEVYGTSNLLELKNNKGFKNLISFFNSHCSLENDKLISLDESLYRIKCLDKEDIESLGFKMRTTSYDPYYIKDQYKIEYAYDKRLIISENTRMVVDKVFDYPGDTLFMGIIKNKFELKKLLIQLNINL